MLTTDTTIVLGFTLVELMVVVVIIGILVAIAIPIYNMIQDSARDSAHEANIRILKGAVEMYRAEYNGAYPAVVTGTPDKFVGWDIFLDAWPIEPGTYEYTGDGGFTFTDPN